ncbi:hypothetical protein ABFX02_06G153400 [Erythranthe guttata]
MAIIGRIFINNVQAAAAANNINRKETKNRAISNNKGGGRRELLLSSTLITTTAIVLDSQTQLLNKYLKKSEENKAKNDKERMDSYYKRNYKDYFQLLEGDLRQKKDLTESEKGILEWLDKNK